MPARSFAVYDATSGDFLASRGLDRQLPVATGLDAAGQYSTARDTVVLAGRMMRSAAVRRIVRRTGARLHGRDLPATNRLLGAGLGIEGVKTGHTDDAGWCIVASAVQRGHRIVIAVLGAPSESQRDGAVRGLPLWAEAARR